MRVKELADLTGATVRTIRYYHEVGLLPVPVTRYGRRDYDLVHVARLTRIRWLARAGVPLSKVPGLLGLDTPGSPAGDRDAILLDLRATAAALEAQLEQLRVQRDQVSRLVASVERDDHLSPMPAAVARFYDDLELRSGDERTRRAIRQERDFMELAFYRGDMPPEAELVYQGLNAVGQDESLALFGEIAARSDSDAGPSDEEVAQIAAAVIERLRRQLGPDLPRVARSIDLEVARRAADLYVQLADPSQRRLGRAIADAMLTFIAREGA